MLKNAGNLQLREGHNDLPQRWLDLVNYRFLYLLAVDVRFLKKMAGMRDDTGFTSGVSRMKTTDSVVKSLVRMLQVIISLNLP